MRNANPDRLDWFKAILELSGAERQEIATSDLAAALGIGSAAVTKMH